MKGTKHSHSFDLFLDGAVNVAMSDGAREEKKLEV
jgi:hypothetical protein